MKIDLGTITSLAGVPDNADMLKSFLNRENTVTALMAAAGVAAIFFALTRLRWYDENGKPCSQEPAQSALPSGESNENVELD